MDDKRVILITGANRGIGLALAKALLQESDRNHVILGCRSPEKGAAAAQELADGGYGDRVQVQNLDVTDKRSVQLAAESVKEKNVSIFALVCNAAVAQDTAWAPQPIPKDCARQTLACNFYGVVWCCEHFMPLLSPGGRVVVVSSGASKMNLEKMGPERRSEMLRSDLTLEELNSMVQSFIASWDCHYEAANMPKLCPDQGWWLQAYGFSKAAADAFTRIAAARARDGGGGDPSHAAAAVLVNACTPGFVKTDMTRGYGGYAGLLEPADGAATPLRLCVGDVGGVSGAMWAAGAVVPWGPA